MKQARSGHRPLARCSTRLLFLCLCAGCASPQGRDQSFPLVAAEEFVVEEDGGFVDYLADRGLDLLDVASLRFIVGPGLRANVRATEVLQLGAGVTGPTADPDRGFSIPAYMIGFHRRNGGLWHQRTTEGGVSLFYTYDTSGEVIKGDKLSFDEGDRGFFDVGFAAHLALLGAEAEFRLDEALDFVLGFFTVDLLDDDGP